MRAILKWTLRLLGALAAVAAIVAALAAAVVYAPLLVQRGGATSDAYLKAVTDTRTTLVQAILGFAVFLGAGVGYLNLRHSRRAHADTLIANRKGLDDTLLANRNALEQTLAVTQRGQVTDRFTKAIEQLGNEKVDVRLGGVYALEQIARDARDVQWPIIEILTAFVREHARRPDEGSLWTETGHPTADIQAIMGVLKRRDPSADRARLDLAHTDLREVGIEGVDLTGADLRGVSFRAAKLAGADLSGATLWYADLGAADLDDVKFVGADLRHVQMNDGTSMRRTDFSDAYIVELYLDGATLDEAILTGADISGIRHKPPPPLAPAPLLQRPVHHPIPTREQLLEAIAKVKEAETSAAPPDRRSDESDGPA